MFKYLFLIISFISISFSSSAETIEIDMVNKLGKEKMVYSIKVAKIDIGDTIIWKSVDKGHNVEFVEMPKGVKKFKSKISKDAEYKFEIPGIYLNVCTPHKSMGMIGLVVVGDNLSNLDKIKKAKMGGKSKKIFKELLKELWFFSKRQKKVFLMILKKLNYFLFLLILFFLFLSKSTFAENKLLMITADYCIYCQIWEKEIGKIYPKTEISKSFPLERIELNEYLFDNDINDNNKITIKSSIRLNNF